MRLDHGAEALVMIGVAYGFAGLLKGALGLGFSTSCLPILVLALGHRESLPLVIIPSIFSNLIVMRAASGFAEAAWAYWPLYLAVVTGIALGLMLLAMTDDRATTAILGGVLIAYVAFALARPAFRIEPRWTRRLLIPIGLINGAVNGVTGSQVMPVVPFLMAADTDPHRFIQAVNAVFTISSAAMFLGLSQAGLFNMSDVVISTAGSVIVYGGVVVGARFRATLSDDAYRHGVLTFLGILGLGLVAQVITTKVFARQPPFSWHVRRTMKPSDRVRIMTQGRPDFSVGPKRQTIWKLREGAVFAVEGWAATLMPVAVLAAWLPGMIAAELAMILAVVLLFSHLGNPKAAWRTIANIRRSWMSRGSVMIGAFVGLGVLAIGFQTLGPVPEMIGDAVFWFQVIAAGFILFYPGFAMAASAGIPFWTTGTLPILSALGGLSTGGAAALAAASFGLSLPIDVGLATKLELVILAAIAMAIMAHLSAAHRAGAGARLSAQLMLREEGLWFWTLAVGVGLVIPVAVLVLSSGGPGSQLALVLAALARMIGDVALRYAILKVGTYESLL